MTASFSASQNPPAYSGYASKILECEELDDYLSSLLLPQVLHAIKYFPLRLPASDIKRFLSFLTLCISVKRSENTPACKALGLKLAIPKKSVYSSFAIYALLKLILPSLRAQFQQQTHRSRTANSTNPEENSSSTEQLARQRRQKLLGICLKTLDGTIPLLRLLLILKCWAKVNAVSAIPNLEKWLSGLQYQTTSSSLPSKRSSIHVLFAHRRWMHRWLQACVPIVVLPLLNSARESRELLSNWMDFWLLQPSRRLLSRRAQVANTNCARCPICQQQQITIPMQTNCDHVYCYTCLWEYLRQQQQQHCKICHQSITGCHPLRIK